MGYRMIYNVALGWLAGVKGILWCTYLLSICLWFGDSVRSM